MKVYINYSASSNISYRGTWEMDVDDEEWAEMSENERLDAIDEFAREQILNDIEWYESGSSSDSDDEDY